MLSCLSFNVLGCRTDGYQPVDVRAPFVMAKILEVDADLVGVQEANTHNTYNYNFCEEMYGPLCVNGPYGCAQLRHCLGSQEKNGTQPNGAGLIIFYKKERFELLKQDARKYTSSEKQVRYYQWVKLLDKTTGKTVVMTNTHWSINWDYKGNVDPVAGDRHRTKQAYELEAFWQGNAADRILFATGDYNCRDDSKWYKIATSRTFKGAQECLETPVKNVYVDQCFVNPETVKVKRYEFLDCTFEKDGETYKISDHNPLLVEVEEL